MLNLIEKFKRSILHLNRSLHHWVHGCCNSAQKVLHQAHGISSTVQREECSSCQKVGFKWKSLNVKFIQKYTKYTKLKRRSTASAQLSAYAHWLETHRQTPKISNEHFKRTDEQTDGRYQVHYLHRFAVDKYLATLVLECYLPWLA